MKLTDRQGFSLISAFLLGNVLSGIGGMGTGVKTGYLSVWFGFCIFMLFARIFQVVICRYPDADFFEIAGRLFGKIGYRIFLFMLLCYSFAATFFSIYNYMDFVVSSVTTGFPAIVGFIMVILISIYFGFKQIKTMGRYAEIALPIVLATVLFLLILGIRECSDFTLPLPVSASQFLQQGWQIFCSPFSEIIFLWIVFDSFENREKIREISVKAGFLTTLCFSLVYLLNVNILGEKLMGLSKFPTFFAASLIEVGSVMEHAESLITLSYSFCDILYGAVCFFIGMKSVVKLLENHSKLLKKAKKITAFSAVIFMFFLYILITSKINLSEYYSYISLGFLPLTTGIPLLMFLLSKQQNKSGNNQKRSSCSKKL